MVIRRLEELRRFQKTLALFARAATPHEAEAAEQAARRVMAQYNIDPVKIGDKSLYDHQSFADNALLKKLREEWLVKHKLKPKPEPSVNTTKPKPRPSNAPPVNTTAKPKPHKSGPVNTTKKPRSADRHLEPNRDRHSPGYMREYMRRRRAEQEK
jgi:Protein of unknown function (DUF2786)